MEKIDKDTGLTLTHSVLIFMLVIFLTWGVGNATWIMVLLNLLWLFFKGHLLMSWGYPIASAVVLFMTLFAVTLLKVYADN